jgi:hypothetical protein
VRQQHRLLPDVDAEIWAALALVGLALVGLALVG